MYHTLKYCQHQLRERQIACLPLQPPPFVRKDRGEGLRPLCPCAPGEEGALHLPWAQPATGSSILPSTNQSLEKAAITSWLLGTGMERWPTCLMFALHSTCAQTSAHRGAAALQAAGPAPGGG